MSELTLRQRLDAYERLMRLDKPIGTLLLLWPTMWAVWIAAEGAPSLFIVWIFALGTLLMRSAGVVMNDYADRHFDAHVERTKNRPLAAGIVSEREALLLAGGVTLCAFLLILPLHRLVWALSVVALFLAASYPLTPSASWRSRRPIWAWPSASASRWPSPRSCTPCRRWPG
jgi:4-hydroxybenzoate polyprenyltransferase